MSEYIPLLRQLIEEKASGLSQQEAVFFNQFIQALENGEYDRILAVLNGEYDRILSVLRLRERTAERMIAGGKSVPINLRIIEKLIAAVEKLKINSTILNVEVYTNPAVPQPGRIEVWFDIKNGKPSIRGSIIIKLGENEVFSSTRGLSSSRNKFPIKLQFNQPGTYVVEYDFKDSEGKIGTGSKEIHVEGNAQKQIDALQAFLSQIQNARGGKFEENARKSFLQSIETKSYDNLPLAPIFLGKAYSKLAQLGLFLDSDIFIFEENSLNRSLIVFTQNQQDGLVYPLQGTISPVAIQLFGLPDVRTWEEWYRVIANVQPKKALKTEEGYWVIAENKVARIEILKVNGTEIPNDRRVSVLQNQSITIEGTVSGVGDVRIAWNLSSQTKPELIDEGNIRIQNLKVTGNFNYEITKTIEPGSYTSSCITEPESPLPNSLKSSVWIKVLPVESSPSEFNQWFERFCSALEHLDFNNKNTVKEFGNVVVEEGLNSNIISRDQDDVIFTIFECLKSEDKGGALQILDDNKTLFHTGENHVRIREIIQKRK